MGYRKINRRPGFGRKPYPTPEEETELASLLKKNGAQELRLLLHRRGNLRYAILATFEDSGTGFVLVRWVTISGSELPAVMSAFMDGYEIKFQQENGATKSIELPYTLCSLPRLNGTREFRILLEEFQGNVFLNLRTYDDANGRWVWGDEWVTVSFFDLDELLPALEKATEMIEAAASK